MFIKFVGTMLIAAFVLVFGNTASANDSGFECTIRKVTNDSTTMPIGERNGYIKECDPIEGNNRPKKIIHLSAVTVGSSGVCLFNETELNWDESGEGFQFGQILYQRIALVEDGKCPNFKSEQFATVPLDLSDEKRAGLFSVIAGSFLDVQRGQMKISELLSGVSLFEKIFSAPYADFKSALKISVEGGQGGGVIRGYSVLDKAGKNYVIYYYLGNRSWHLEGKVVKGKLKIVGVSS